MLCAGTHSTKASDRGNFREGLAGDRDSSECGRKVQWSEVGDRRQVVDDVRAYPHRCRIARAAVNHAMSDRLEALHRADGILEHAVFEATTFGVKFAFGQNRIVWTDQAHLERARPCVDDQYAHAPT